MAAGRGNGPWNPTPAGELVAVDGSWKGESLLYQVTPGRLVTFQGLTLYSREFEQHKFDLKSLKKKKKRHQVSS